MPEIKRLLITISDGEIQSILSNFDTDGMIVVVKDLNSKREPSILLPDYDYDEVEEIAESIEY